MTDVLGFVMEFLCQKGTVSHCQQFVLQFTTPIEQMLWFIFFPSIFLIILVYLISIQVLEKIELHKLQALFAVAVYLIIIFQGWYHWILVFSRFWFLAIILMGALWAIVSRMGVREGGGAARSYGREGSSGSNRGRNTRGKQLFRSVFGRQELDPVNRLENTKMVRDEIKVIDSQLKVLDDEKTAARSDRERAVIQGEINQLKLKRKELEEYLKSGVAPESSRSRAA